MLTKSKVKKKKLLKEKVKGLGLDEIQLVRALCKKSFYHFVKEFWDTISAEPPHWNWHVKYLCDQMERMARRVFARQKKKYDLLVNISPGTTKSTIMSIMFPVWCWIHMPEMQFIGCSYVEAIAVDNSNKSRTILNSEKFKKCFPEIILEKDTELLLTNTKGGWRYAVGIGGPVTGKHAHFIVIDDPINPRGATSAAKIKEANSWIVDTLSTRKVNKTVTPMALVMQRLHQNDPSAQFIKRWKKGLVKWICLPAVMSKNVKPEKLKDNYVKGLMDPIRLDKDYLKEERGKGSLYFASQFQQDPAPPGGYLFKVNRIKKTKFLPSHFWRVVRAWDKAGTKGGGAYTVGTKMGVERIERKGKYYNRYWVLDVVRGQWDSSEREDIIKQTAMDDGEEVVVVIEQEPGSGGKESAEATAINLDGYTVMIVKVDVSTGGKLQRADPFSSQVNAGNVYMVEADWNDEWKEELKYFPNSTNMDQVDSAGLAFSECRKPVIYLGSLEGCKT